MDRPVRGFTLIEVIVTLIVLSVVGAFVARPLIDMVQTQASISGVATSQADRDYAIARMAKAIRLSDSGESVSCSSSPETLTVGSDEFAFDGNAETITLSNDVLNNEVLVDGIETFECEPLLPKGLRLYEIKLGAATVRAFKRDIY